MSGSKVHDEAVALIKKKLEDIFHRKAESKPYSSGYRIICEGCYDPKFANRIG